MVLFIPNLQLVAKQLLSDLPETAPDEVKALVLALVYPLIDKELSQKIYDQLKDSLSISAFKSAIHTQGHTKFSIIALHAENSLCVRELIEEGRFFATGALFR